MVRSARQGKRAALRVVTTTALASTGLDKAQIQQKLTEWTVPLRKVRATPPAMPNSAKGMSARWGGKACQRAYQDALV